MGFQNCLSQRFTEESIHKNAPAVPGVYGLWNAQPWLYIGESNDVRASFLAHLGKALTQVPRAIHGRPCRQPGTSGNTISSGSFRQLAKGERPRGGQGESGVAARHR